MDHGHGCMGQLTKSTNEWPLQRVNNYLVEFGELCILVFNGRTRSLVQGHLDESGGDIEAKKLSLLGGA